MCWIHLFFFFNHWLNFMGFPGGSVSKKSPCNAGDLGSIPGLGRSLGEGNSYPLQYSGLENSMDYVVHGVTKSWTRLSNFHIFIITKTNNTIIISTHKYMCSSCCVNKMPQSPTPGLADGVSWRVFSHGSNLPRAKHILLARPCQGCVSHRQFPPHWEEAHQTVL